MAYTSRPFPTISARRPSQGSAADARGAKRKRGFLKAPGGRVWPIPRDLFPRFRQGAQRRGRGRRKRRGARARAEFSKMAGSGACPTWRKISIPFRIAPFAQRAMKRDARGRAGRIALKTEAANGRTCYTKFIFSLLRFRAAGKNRPRGPNAISPQILAFTGVNSPTHFEAPSPASTLRSNEAACLIEVF